MASPTSWPSGSALPAELKAIICRDLDWAVYDCLLLPWPSPDRPTPWPRTRRLGLTCKASLKLNWSLVSTINSDGEDADNSLELQALAALPPPALPNLRHLRLSFASNDLVDPILGNLSLFSRLETLKLEDSEAVTILRPSRPIRLPSSLLAFSLGLPIHNHEIDPLLAHISSDLTKLKTLKMRYATSSKFPIQIESIRLLSSLRNLEVLSVGKVKKMPRDAPAVLSLLLALPPQVITSSKLALDWIRPRILHNQTVKSMVYAQALYELGFRPKAFASARGLLTDEDFSTQYFQRSWVDVSPIRANIYKLLHFVKDKRRFELFHQHIFLPLASADPQQNPSSLWHYIYEPYLGVWMCPLIYAHKFFVAELFSDPGRLSFDGQPGFQTKHIHRFPSNYQPVTPPVHWYAVNDDMEAFFVAKGLDVDTSAPRLDVLLNAWRAVTDFWTQNPGDWPNDTPALDGLFVFKKLFQNRQYFYSNAKDIMQAAISCVDAVALAGMLRQFLIADPPIKPSLVRKLLLGMNPTQPHLLVNMLRGAAFDRWVVAFGAWRLAGEILGWPHKATTFADGQNLLHILFQQASKKLDTSHLVSRAKAWPGTRQLVDQVDDFGRFPLYYWLGLLYKPGATKQFKKPIASLIASLAPATFNTVDAKGTSVWDRIQELRKATAPDLKAKGGCSAEEFVPGLLSDLGIYCSYPTLPHELRVIINEGLDWKVVRRVGMANRSLLAESWSLVSSIEMSFSQTKTELSVLSSVPSAQLSALRHLRLQLPDATTANSFLPSLPLFTRLTHLSLTNAGFSSKEPIRLPKSLVDLNMLGRLSQKESCDLLAHICTDLTNLRVLKIHFQFTFASLSGLANLKQLEVLSLSVVEGLPRDKTLVPFLATLPRRLLTSPDFSIDRISSKLLHHRIVNSLDFAQALYDLGFRPVPLVVFHTLMQREEQMPRLYVKLGWAKPADLRHRLPSLLTDVSDKQRFDRFIDLIYRPLVDNYPSSSSAGVLWHRDAKSGLWISALVYAHKFFVEELLRDPERIQFDSRSIPFGHPVHWFAVNEKMESFFTAQGLPIDTSPERLKVLQVALRSMVDLSLEESVQKYSDLSLNATFVFDKLWNNPEFFEANAEDILQTYARSREWVALARVVGFVLVGKHRIPAQVVENFLLSIKDPDHIMVYIPKDAFNQFGYTAAAIGGPRLFEAMFYNKAFYYSTAVYRDKQNFLHVVFRQATNKSYYKMLGKLLGRMEKHDQELSPLLKQADAFGKYPINYWVELLFKHHPHEEFKQAVSDLIVKFAEQTSSKVDTKGTGVWDRFARLNREASNKTSGLQPPSNDIRDNLDDLFRE